MSKNIFFFFFFVFALVLNGSLFGNEEYRDSFKNTIVLNTTVLGFGAGLSYERNLSAQFSVGAEASFDMFLILFENINGSIFGRFYPMRNREFYAELVLDY
jgi:hypothetical protein